MKKGFTLIELLAVVVILSLIFLFITPKLIDLIKKGKNSQKEIIEQKIIIASKDYVNSNASIYESFVNEGDTYTISKNDLLNAELIDSEELKNFNFEVLVRLSPNDKLVYTVIYN